MCPAPESPGGPSATAPSPSSPTFVFDLTMGSPEAASPGASPFLDGAGAADMKTHRSPPTAEQPAAEAGDANCSRGGSQGTSCQQQDSPAADTPAVEPEPLPSPVQPAAGGGSGGGAGGHPKGLPPLKRARQGRQEHSQPSSTDRSKSGALLDKQGEHGASLHDTVQPPSAKRAKLASDSLTRTESLAASDAAVAGASLAPDGGLLRNPLGGAVLPPRPARAARTSLASAIPAWVQAAATAPSANAALLKAAAKCPPHDCPAAWHLGLDRDQRWSYVVHGAPGEIVGAEEDAPPLQGWAALHAAAAAAPRDLAACATMAEAIRLGQEQRQVAAEEAHAGNEGSGPPRSVRRRGLNLSELSAMVSAAAAGHTSRSAEEESLAERTRRVLRAPPSRRRGARNAAAAAATATGAGPLSLGRTLAEKMAHGGSASLPPRPQRNKPGPKPKPKTAAPLPPQRPARQAKPKPKPQPKPKPKAPKPRARPAPAGPALPPPLPSKDGVWTAGDTWPRAALFAAGRGSTLFLSLNAAAKKSEYDGEGTDMEAWKRLHEALRKAGKLPDPLPGR